MQEQFKPFVHPVNLFNNEDLVAASSKLSLLMQGRRSVRTFSDKPIPAEVIHNLVSIAASAPIICQNTSNTFTVSGLADLGITYGIRFKYSTTPLANPYLTTAGTVMGTVANANLTGGGTGAAVTYSFPTSGTMYVYAILTPNSPDPTCRPYVSMTFQVAATPALTDPTDQVLCTGSTTAAVSNNSTQVATTAYVRSRLSIDTSYLLQKTQLLWIASQL